MPHLQYFCYVCNVFGTAMAHEKLYQLILEGKWEMLHSAFALMSRSDFRRAEFYIRTAVLPQLPNDAFWDTLFHLVTYRRQAFLSGVLAIDHLATDHTLNFQTDGAIALARHLQATHPSSITKAASMMMPLMQTEQQAAALLHTFHIKDIQQLVGILLRTDSPLSYYMLFNELRHHADNRALVLSCCRHILRRNNDMAYNMAALLQAYFGLHELRGQFSLHIEPYELSRLERDPQTFYHILNGKRPLI